MLINRVLQDLFNNNERIVRLQNQIATGRIVNQVSDDPLIADQVMDLETRIARAAQYVRNADASTSFLSLADSSLGEVNELGVSARTLAVKMANDTVTAEMRAQAAGEVQQLLEEAVDLANRSFRDRYIFGGHQTLTPPFEITADGVIYHGDMEHVDVQLTGNGLHQMSVNGAEVFGGMDARVTGAVDLDPALDLTADGTRLSDLNSGRGAAAGWIRVVHSGGTVTDVDLTAAETIQDAADLIADATGLTVGLNASANGLQISGGGGPISVQESGGGTTARDLGILGSAAGPLLVGSDLDPAVTSATKLGSLLGGAGFDSSGFVITNGSQTDTFDPGNWGTTVGDLIAAINASSVNVHAAIDASGNRLEIFNRVSGSTMTITENGGSTAAQLGVLETVGVRADNLFAAMMDLRDALTVNDRDAISASIGLLDGGIDKLLAARGEVGARLQRIQVISGRQEDEEFNLTTILSEVNDVDYSEAVLNFQNLRNVMEAALGMAAQVLPRSLADFL
jgi:flagellar hook-associated protein 3 FlgL